MHEAESLVAPEGSLYFWCYSMGLKHVPIEDVLHAANATGRSLREKDVQNYWNGYHRSNLYGDHAGHDMFVLRHFKESKPFLSTNLSDYPVNPNWCKPEIEERWVPCNAANKPMIKWGNGCMSREDAESIRNQVYLAENTKGTSFVIIDCDGDHDDELDLDVIRFLYRYTGITHTMFKPKLVSQYEGYKDSGINMPASFHLTFVTDRVIPTMHFPKSHIDIIGNKCNSLRYRKNKIWNGIQPRVLTPFVWEEIKSYIREKEGSCQ